MIDEVDNSISEGDYSHEHGEAGMLVYLDADCFRGTSIRSTISALVIGPLALSKEWTVLAHVL